MKDNPVPPRPARPDPGLTERKGRTPPSHDEIGRISAKQVAKAFHVPMWIISEGTRPCWFRRQVQRWSGYRLWL